LRARWTAAGAGVRRRILDRISWIISRNAGKKAGEARLTKYERINYVIIYPFDLGVNPASQIKDKEIFEEMDEDEYEKLKREEEDWIEDDGTGKYADEDEEEEEEGKRKGKKKQPSTWSSPQAIKFPADF
jgi:hypothetical protein